MMTIKLAKISAIIAFGLFTATNVQAKQDISGSSFFTGTRLTCFPANDYCCTIYPEISMLKYNGEWYHYTARVTNPPANPPGTQSFEGMEVGEDPGIED
jgi:hypothetical protein